MVDEMTKEVKSHFLDPRNVGTLDRPSAVGTAGSVEECGDIVKIYIRVDSFKITDISFLAEGCPSAIASASMTTQIAKGLSIFEASMITGDAVSSALGGLSEHKLQCSNLGANALKSALENLVSGDFLEETSSEGKKSAVAMSGGVDSSTVAALLVDDGKDVIGLTMRLHDSPANGEISKSCCSPRDIDDAWSVSNSIGMPHFTIDLRKEFKQHVVDDFYSEYIKGRTPNPCIQCNRKIKFTALKSIAEKLGAKKISTGHYVKIDYDGVTDRYEVRMAKDRSKDQSYMFWGADQSVLATFDAPLGNIDKSEVRELAKGYDLLVAKKAESQEICFIPDNDYRGFLKDRGYAPLPGPIIDKMGKSLGTHGGLPFFTVGQRKGLGIASNSPLYVTDIKPETNTLIVGQKSDFDKASLIARESNFIPFDKLTKDIDVEVKYRYNMLPVPARIFPLEDESIKVDLKSKSDTGIAPGQSVVFYKDDLVIGGGIIYE